MQKPTDFEFQALRDLVEKWSGIAMASNKAYLIETRLHGLIQQCGAGSYADFIGQLQSDKDPALRDQVIDLMTTNETLWFRDRHPFTIFEQDLIPEYVQQLRSGKRRQVRIWSAACSTGQEPYSLAMVWRERMRAIPDLNRARLEILASDISLSALRLAKRARYENVAMSRGLDRSYRDRYFKQEGRVWSLDPDIVGMVKLKKINLQDSFTGLGRFDVILCRNVAIYFADDFKRELFGKLANALTPDGVLFLGASESILTHSDRFTLRKGSSGVYYQLAEVAGAMRERSA